MIAEDCSIARLMDQTRMQVRQAHTLVDRVSGNLTALRSGFDEDAEGGWRRYSF